uniref:Uncharacterized protein n=2 Tax=Caenorhabditis japonica TaxID=281687 RepID=A0A8R1I551_CAEJA
MRKRNSIENTMADGLYSINTCPRSYRNISSLTVRYQLEEIFLSTRFAVLVVFVHICFLGFYLTFVIGVRNYGYLMISDPITVTAFRAAAISLIATYNLIIGFVAVYLFKRIQKKKKGEIKGEVQMKATGRDGARNYDNAIFSVWNSLSSSAERSRR